MATTVFDLKATLGLDSSKYDSGLNKAKSAGSTFGSGLAKAAKVGLTAVTAATGALVGFGVSSVKTGAEFDKSMSQVAATMGKTMEEMQNEVGTVDLAWGTFSGNLREYAQEMGKNTAFSATEAADALNYMALAGYDTQTSMEMLPNVLNLAAAGNMDLARASDMVTDTQTAFGISLERTSQMVDEMAKAASTGNTSVEQLGDAFLTVGGLAQELNGGMVTLADGTQKPVDGVQELEIALTAMANAGIKGSEAGTHMRNMLLKLSDPTDDGVAALESMGVAVFDTEGKMRSLSDVFSDLSTQMATMTQEEKISTIADLFNTRDIASAEALLNAVGQDWDKIGESILNAEGAAQKMADTQLDNLAGDITLFKSALEGAKIAVSDQLTPALRDFVQFGTQGLSKVTSAFQEGGLSGAMTAFGEVLSDGLNMIIEKLPEFVDAGMKLLGALGQGLLDNLPVIIDAAVQIIQQLMLGLVQALPQLVEGGMQIILGLAQGIAEMLPTLIPTIVEVVLQIVQTLIENIDLLVNAAIQLMTGLANGLIQALPIIIEKLPEIVQAIVEALINNLPLLITAVLEINMALVQAIVENAPLFVDAVVQILMMIIQTMTSYGSQLVSQTAQMFSQVVQTAVQWLQQLPQRAAYFAGQMLGMFINAIMNLPNKVTELFTKVMNAVINFGQKFIAEGPRMANQFSTGIMSIMKQLPSKMMEVGRNMINKLKEGVAGAWDSFKGWLADLVNNFMGGLIDSAKNKLPSMGGGSGSGGSITGLAVGTDYVPYDNFPALLHKGEMVVPAKISEDLRDFIGGNIKSVQPTNNLTSQPIQVTVVLEGDADRLFRVMQAKATSNYRVTGQRDLVTV